MYYRGFYLSFCEYRCLFFCLSFQHFYVNPQPIVFYASALAEHQFNPSRFAIAVKGMTFNGIRDAFK